MAAKGFNLLFLSLLLASSQLEFSLSHSLVNYLPGFNGPLPFELETGYVGVGESEDVQLFYYFTESESNPKEDPLMLWLTGGPGCSAFSGLAYEIGPLNFDDVESDGSLPNLVLNPNSWTKVASIIFLDSPVGTGFSYARNSNASQCTDLQSCEQVYQFMRKWLIDHPEFLANPFYVGGDSYSGITVPIIVQLISDGSESGIEPLINLQGYLLGNPITNPDVENNYKIPFAHGMGLISDELYEKNCDGEYFDVDPSNTKCLQNVESYSQCIDGINPAQILEPTCGFASPRPLDFFSKRSPVEPNIVLVDPKSSPCATSRINKYRLSYPLLNDEGVQEALHIQRGYVGQWMRCNYGVHYTRTVYSSFPYHVNLSTKGYRSLIYSGDRDMLVQFMGTQAWIRTLNYSIVEHWRSWIVEGQVAGYTRTYSNKMTFATMKGGGHTAPEYRPVEAFAMFKRWISHLPL